MTPSALLDSRKGVGGCDGACESSMLTLRVLRTGLDLFTLALLFGWGDDAPAERLDGSSFSPLLIMLSSKETCDACSTLDLVVALLVLLLLVLTL
jgi:hypothetical protein